MNKPLIVSAVTALVLVTGIFSAQARPEYARKENRTCGYCHLNAGGGGDRGFRGLFYGANNLSFAMFKEDREASIAAVEANADTAGAKAKVGYAGNVSGPRPAPNQIQALALRAPVIVVFFSGHSPEEVSAAKLLRKVALAFGPSVFVVGVIEGDFTKALSATTDLASQIRVFADVDGGAAQKFGATHGLDMVAISKMGNNFSLISGFSKGNLERLIAQIGTYGVQAPTVDIGDAPATTTRAKSLGGK